MSFLSAFIRKVDGSLHRFPLYRDADKSRPTLRISRAELPRTIFASQRSQTTRLTRAGAAAGGLTGGVVGALTQAGVSKEDADIYAEGLRRGGAVVSARVPDRDASRLQAIMDRSAVDIAERGAAYRQAGWKSFNPTATPYTAEQIRKERDLYVRR